MGAYFERLDGDRYRPTLHTGGAWNAAEIHFSPLGGLIVHAIDLHREAQEPDSKQLGRISFDILGFLAADDCTISVETIRPGRTIELVEASVSIGGRTAVLARAWFIDVVDTTSVAGGAPAALPGPDALSPWPMDETWPGGYIDSLEVRPLIAPAPGRATAYPSDTSRS